MVIGVLLDRYSKFLLTLRVVCFGTTVVAMICTGVFPLNKVKITSGLMVLAGLILLPIIPVCISFASEVTFPMQAAMINGGVQLAGHLIGFLMELISVAILKKSTFALMCFFCVIAIFGAILSIFVTEDLRRKNHGKSKEIFEA
jgi:small-conductance mechanosensitive channel